MTFPTFNHETLRDLWGGLVAGWADHLDPTGALLIIEGVHNDADLGGSYEGASRMLWGLGSWLADPSRPTVLQVSGRSYDLVALCRRALLAGTDPASPSYWGTPQSNGSAQVTVESGQVAYALWQSRNTVWGHLERPEQKQIVAWLDACSVRPESWRNNWALFWAVNHAARKALDQPHDQALIDSVMNDYLDRIYVGDGWYDDGPQRGTLHFDDYNLWVFASHVLAWAEMDGANSPDRRVDLLDRIRRLMQHIPLFYASSGATPEYGRSSAYKFARLGALLWAYQHGVWPHSAGLLLTIVTRHFGWYLEHGAMREDGTLRQTITANGSPNVRERYISTGAPYWAMQAFGGLWSIPESDPFWTATPEPLPIDRGDVFHVLPEPGWIIAGTSASGHIHRYPTHVAPYPAKYAKHVYSTAAPYNAPDAERCQTPDAAIGLVTSAGVTHRNANCEAHISRDGWLRYTHQHRGTAEEATFDTIIVPTGDLHLRVHRIVGCSPGDQVEVIEGAAALGADDISDIETMIDDSSGVSAAWSDTHIVAIRTWDNLRSAFPPSDFGEPAANVVYANQVIPFVRGRVRQGDMLITTVFLGSREQLDAASVNSLLGDRPQVRAHRDGTIRIVWAGRSYTIGGRK